MCHLTMFDQALRAAPKCSKILKQTLCIFANFFLIIILLDRKTSTQNEWYMIQLYILYLDRKTSTQNEWYMIQLYILYLALNVIHQRFNLHQLYLRFCHYGPLDNKNFWKTAKIYWGGKLIFSMLRNIHQLFPVPFHCFSSASMP